MMNKNDIRRGNYLRDHVGRIVQVNQLKENGHSCLYKGQQNTSAPGVRESYFEFDQLSYIKIDPELLCKISKFTNNGYMAGYYGITVQANMHIDFVIKWLETKNHFSFELKMGHWPLVRKFKYLHDLQNFFYAFWEVELFIDGLIIDELNGEIPVKRTCPNCLQEGTIKPDNTICDKCVAELYDENKVPEFN